MNIKKYEEFISKIKIINNDKEKCRGRSYGYHLPDCDGKCYDLIKSKKENILCAS